MYRGKHVLKSNKRSKKRIALLVSLLLLLCVSVGGAIAFLMDSTTAVTNTFTPAHVTTAVQETIAGAEKKDVAIKNTGDTSAWIRACVVVSWQDADGNVYGKVPSKGTDYSISFTTNWLEGSDGYYYYPYPVAAGDSTPVLVDSCSPISSSTVPEGYTLTVEIIGSGIQSTPVSVFGSVWGSSGLSVNSNGTAVEKVN